MDCNPDSRRLHPLGQKGPLSQITQLGLCLLAHVDAQSLLVSNVLSQRSGSSSLSFLAPLFGLVGNQFVKLGEGLGCLMDATDFICRLKSLG